MDDRFMGSHFEMQPGDKVNHSFSEGAMGLLPEATPEISRLVQARDAQGLCDLIQNATGGFIDPESQRRLNSLLWERTVTDREIGQIIAHGDLANLGRMLDRIEERDAPAIRQERASDYERLQNTYNFNELGLTFKEEEQLDALLEQGRLDVKVVEYCLKKQDVERLRDEIEAATRNLDHDRGRNQGMVRTA